MNSTATMSIPRVKVDANPEFLIMRKSIKCEHNFQFYMDFGTTQFGPWAKFGLNEVEYVVGFSPPRNSGRPSPVATTTETSDLES